MTEHPSFTDILTPYTPTPKRPANLSEIFNSGRRNRQFLDTDLL